MFLTRSCDHVAQRFQRCVLAIGNFDGVHLGHQALIKRARELAIMQAAPLAVMTFHPHPRRYFAPHSAALAIEPPHMRLRRLRALGVEAVFALPFNEALANMEATLFIEELLVQRLHVRSVVIGEDFHFGKGRGGTPALLEREAARLGFSSVPVPPVAVDGAPVSSSRIRACLDRGAVDEAAALLGRPYQLCGRVVHGRQLGHALGAPTANLRLSGLHLPRYGVYAVEFAVSGGADCVEGSVHWLPGVANLGVRPTLIADGEPLLEVHSLTPVEPLYGQRLRVRMLSFLRDEQRFEDASALSSQIQCDIEAARAVHARVGAATTQS